MFYIRSGLTRSPTHKDRPQNRCRRVPKGSKPSLHLPGQAHAAPVYLTTKEYQMLELLSLRKGTTLTKEMFLNHLYGGMDEPELKIIDVFICKIRRKLANASAGKNYIETIWGRGYVLREPIEDETRLTA